MSTVPTSNYINVNPNLIKTLLSISMCKIPVVCGLGCFYQQVCKDGMHIFHEL